jgi:uncharacterized protein Yka (UPF0111/DUF47 family)
MEASKVVSVRSDTLLKAIDRMTKVLDLYARVQGEIESEKHLHIHQNPDVQELIQSIHQALEPYPEALAAVMKAVEKIA